MKLTIQAVDFQAPEPLKVFIEKQLGKLDRFSDRIQEAVVYLRVAKSDKPEKYLSEIKLVIPGKDLFASRQCASFEESVDTTIEALKHQLERWKNSNERLKAAQP